MLFEEFVETTNDWEIYRTSEHSNLYALCYEQFNSYLYKKSEVFKHLGDENADLYTETVISVNKYYYPSVGRFYYRISISNHTPELGTGRLNFEQTLPDNVELTADYVDSLRKLFNV